MSEITDEMVDLATRIVISELGPENMKRLQFGKESATTSVIISDIVSKALKAALPARHPDIEVELLAALQECEREIRIALAHMTALVEQPMLRKALENARDKANAAIVRAEGRT